MDKRVQDFLAAISIDLDEFLNGSREVRFKYLSKALELSVEVVIFRPNIEAEAIMFVGTKDDVAPFQETNFLAKWNQEALNELTEQLHTYDAQRKVLESA